MDLVIIDGENTHDQLLVSEKHAEFCFPMVNNAEQKNFQSGVGLLKKLLEDDFEIKMLCTSDIFYNTISKWVIAQVDPPIDNENRRLFLEKHLFRINNKLELKDGHKDDFSDNMHGIFSIYNISLEKSASTYEYYQNLTIQTEDWFVVRTLMRENRKASGIVEAFVENGHASKTVLLFAANDLRYANYLIDIGTSWEQLCVQSYNAILGDEALRKFAYVVICFEHEGCLIIRNNKDNTHSCSLLYYYDKIEGDFSRQKGQGSRAFGYILTMQAAITRCLAGIKNDKRKMDEVHNALKSAAYLGLVEMRELRRIGFNLDGQFPVEYFREFRRGLSFQNKPTDISCIDFDNTSMQRDVSILQKITDKDSPETNLKLFNTCSNIVKKGIELGIIGEEHTIPLLRYNHLISVDRYEIEGFRNIFNILSNYMSDSGFDRPLSICVFGPPGSGKSFGVKQIAMYLGETSFQELTEMTYNLSQMRGIDDLNSALHQVRDEGLKGKLPLVFWDEFDSQLNKQDYGWLKCFLAPMQDGEFRQDSIQHFIGRAIFVFAGGVYHSMNEFLTPLMQSKDSEEKKKDEVLAKLPDFASRIKGFLDILGPNKVDCKKFSTENARRDALYLNGSGCEKKVRTPRCEYAKRCCCEEGYYLRRAVLLRSLLECKLCIDSKTEIFIEDNVLHALLHVDKYKHGARSMDAIIQMSSIRTNRICVSDLPHSSILNLHLTDDFFGCIHNRLG